jgi:dipeptidyl aminopeptidase/acylaminoacyl peptidase
LSLLLATASEIGNSGTEDPLELADGGVAAVVAYFPPSRFMDRSPEKRAMFPALDVPSEQLEALSPLQYASSDDPPTLIIHGDQDPQVVLKQGRQMHEALLGAGVESQFIVVEGAEHGFFGEDADFALAESLSWFQRHLLR